MIKLHTVPWEVSYKFLVCLYHFLCYITCHTIILPVLEFVFHSISWIIWDVSLWRCDIPRINIVLCQSRKSAMLSFSAFYNICYIACQDKPGCWGGPASLLLCYSHLLLASLSLGLDTMVTVLRPWWTSHMQGLGAGIVYLATGQLQCDCDIWPLSVLLVSLCCWQPIAHSVGCTVNSSTEVGSCWLRKLGRAPWLGGSCTVTLGGWLDHLKARRGVTKTGYVAPPKMPDAQYTTCHGLPPNFSFFALPWKHCHSLYSGNFQCS